jgi:hypothetical protein
MQKLLNLQAKGDSELLEAATGCSPELLGAPVEAQAEVEMAIDCNQIVDR